MEKIPMTKHGADLLRHELHNLKKNRRPKVIQAIAEARAHGDLRENAEYHAAKDEQAFVEGRIRELEQKLSHCHIVDIQELRSKSKNSKIVFGVTVKLLNVDTEDNVQYQIVGEDEANLEHGKISFTSPIARALIGKEEGDTAEVQAPGGVITYEIEEVLYL